MQHFFARHGVLVATLRVQNPLGIAPPILQLDLQIDAVAPFVSEGLELRVF